MSNQPAVSVLVATYNCADLLQIALQTAIHQDLKEIEILVIGDGCTDHSETIVAAIEDSRLVWHNLERNHRAPHAAHNFGLQMAKGRYIAYLNHDDLWFPWHLRHLVEFIEMTSADFVYAMLCLVREEQGSVCIGQIPAFQKTIFGMPSGWLHKNPLLGGNLQWKDPYEVGHATDSNYIIRANAMGAKLAYLPRLGALKFDSSAWGTYGRKEYPQVRYLQRLLQEPQELKLELLEESASTMSLAEHFSPLFDTTAKLAKRLLRHWAWTAYNFFGENRFPLLAIRRAFFHWKRRKMNQQRGLKF